MKNVLTLIICLICAIGNAQNIKAHWSQFTEVEKTDRTKIVGVTDERIVIAVKSKESKKPTKLIELGREFGSYSTMEAKFEGEKVIDVVVLNGHTVVLSSKRLEDKTQQLHARTIRDGEFSAPKPLCKSIYHNSEFEFSVSPNGEYLGVIANAPYRKGKNEEIESWIFKGDLSLVQDYKMALKSDNRKLKINVPIMSNTGVFFVIKRYRVGLDNNYYVFAIDPTTGKHLRKTLTLMGKRVADVKYELDSDNNLHLAGFYVSSSYNVYEGSFYFKLDQTARAITFKQNAFTEEFLIQAEGKKKFKKHGGLVDFKINEMTRHNGKIYLTASHHHNEKLELGSEVKTLHGREKLALVCLKTDGTADFVKTLKLDQHTNNDKGVWNQDKILVKDDQIVIAHNTKEETKVLLSLSKIVGEGFTSIDISSIYSELSEPVGLNLQDIHVLENCMVVAAWNLDRTKFSIGILSPDDSGK